MLQIKSFFNLIGTAGVIQIILSTLACVASIIGLSVEFNARSQYRKRNAVILFSIALIIGGLSGWLVYQNARDVKDEKVLLAKRNDTLLRKNDTLRRKNDTLQAKVDSARKENSNSFKSQSNLIIVKQQETANQLVTAAKGLSNLIGGTDSVPVLLFANYSNNKIIGILRNLSVQPAYNIEGVIANYDSLLLCKGNLHVVSKNQTVMALDNDCIEHCQKVFKSAILIQGRDGEIDPLPLSFKIQPSGKFILTLTYKNKLYEELCYYKIVNNFIQQTTKIFQIQNSKIVKSWVYNISKNPKEIPKINWSIEFPFHLYNTRRWKY